MKNNGYGLSKEKCEEVIRKAAFALVLYCETAGIHFVVTGVSGGLDSAVTIGIAERACQIARDNGYDLYSVGVLLPCHSTAESFELGRAVIEKFNAYEVTVHLSDIFDSIYQKNNGRRGFEKSLIECTDMQIMDILEKTDRKPANSEWDETQKITQGNIKARLRMMLGTYDIARKMNGMVLSTDNLSEFWMAFWTICGDVGDYSMIQNVLKGLELYDIARYLEVPRGTIDARPDDGNGVADGDEAQIGVHYVGVDIIMITAKQNGFNPDSSDFGQIDEVLPKLNLDYSEDVIRMVLERSIRGAFKRHGTIKLSRGQLGLPPIMEI